MQQDKAQTALSKILEQKNRHIPGMKFTDENEEFLKLYFSCLKDSLNGLKKMYEDGEIDAQEFFQILSNRG